MFIKKEHVLVLRELRGSVELGAFAEKRVIDRVRFSRRIMELYIMGLIKRKGDNIELTEAGQHLVKAIENIDIDSLPDPWIDSRIIEVIELAKTTGLVPDPWIKLLEERQLWSDGWLNNVAEEVYNAYVKADTLIYITPEIAEFILSLSPGPAPYDELIRHIESGGYGGYLVNALEAMRIIKISPPYKGGSIYMMTPLGRRVKKALYKIPVYDSVILIDSTIVDAFLRSERSSAEEHSLRTMHLINSGGKRTEAGHELTASYRESRKITFKILPIALSVEELNVLKTIRELMEKTMDKPYPTIDDISKKLGSLSNLSILINLLESKELIARHEYKGKDTYKLTSLGQAVIDKLRDIRRDIRSYSTKTVSYVIVGRIPKTEWVIRAREDGLVHRDITGRGWFLLELSARITRKPILSRYDALILRKLPSKGMKYNELFEYLLSEGVDEKTIEYSISECESKGYIEVYPNDYVKMTDTGLLMKEVIISGNTEELTKSELSITPTIYNILRIIAENINELKKTWVKGGGRKLLEEEAKIIYNNLKGLTSITINEIMSTMALIRGYGLLGKLGLTDAGKKLLEVGEKFKSYVIDPSIIRVYR